MTEALRSDFECLIEEQSIIGQSPQGKEFADFDRWIREFSEYQEVVSQWKRETLNFLDREAVRRICQRCISESDLKGAFLIVMIWGYSGDARGPVRTRQITEQANFLKSLEATYKFLSKNQIQEAYESLIVNGPKFLSTSFGTKILYFFSTSNTDIQPLIFDRRIFLILDNLGLAVGKTPVLTSKQYMDYLRMASELAKNYSISIGQVEENLFILSGLNSGNYSWKRKVSFESFNAEQRDKLAALLAKKFASYATNSNILLNGNGGGQYGGYVVTGEIGSVEYELHASTSDGVNLIKPEFVRFDWDSVLFRGIAQSIRDLATTN